MGQSDRACALYVLYEEDHVNMTDEGAKYLS